MMNTAGFAILVAAVLLGVVLGIARQRSSRPIGRLTATTQHSPPSEPTVQLTDARRSDTERRAPVAEAGAPFVFISYSRADKTIVNQLVDHLARAGVRSWVDTSDVDYGTRWESELKQSLDRCAAVAVVMTPASEESEWVEIEIKRAKKLGKPILPLLLAGEEFFGLSHLQHDSIIGGIMPSRGWVERVRRITAQT